MMSWCQTRPRARAHGMMCSPFRVASLSALSGAFSGLFLIDRATMAKSRPHDHHDDRRTTEFFTLRPTIGGALHRHALFTGRSRRSTAPMNVALIRPTKKC